MAGQPREPNDLTTRLGAVEGVAPSPQPGKDFEMTQTFRKKPVEIQAVQYTGENPMEVADFMDHAGFTFGSLTNALIIHTLEGEMRVSDGDWVIRGVAGEFYPCKPDIFDATYEPVST